MNDNHSAENYLSSCRSDFWKSVFDAESDYLTEHLSGCVDVLSVGCGPAVIEGILSERGFNVTGLDVSQEALRAAPDSVRTVQGPAETLPFKDSSFDAVIFVVSLQFIENPADAIRDAARVLKTGGRLIALLLNPASSFFKDKMRQPDSYVRTIKHSDLKLIEDAISEQFITDAEYFLGIDGDAIDPQCRSEDSALRAVRGVRF